MDDQIFASDFDFSDSFALFAKFIDEQHPEYRPENLTEAPFSILKMPQFKEFCVYFFSDERFWSKLEIYHSEPRNSVRITTNLEQVELYDKFSSVSFPKRNKTHNLTLPLYNNERCFPSTLPAEGSAVRRQSIYPLNYNETELSMDFIERHLDYEIAMLAIKMCIVDYLVNLGNSLSNHFGTNLRERTDEKTPRNQLSEAFEQLIINAVGFSMLQDLMPILGNTMRKSDSPFAEKTLHASFQDAFKRHSFKSMAANTDRGFKKCPFAMSLTDLMRLRLENDENGDLQAMQTEHPGALIASVRNLIREKYFQALPPKHPVYDIIEEQEYA